MTIRILLTGGGSGGHIIPLVAVARKIQESVDSAKTMVTIQYFGNPGIYREYLLESGIGITPVAESKFRRYFDLKNFLDIFKFIFSLLQSFWKVFLYMPDVTFSKGGPGVLSVITACRFYRIPIIVHESDAVAGITNRISAKSARILEVAFPSAARVVGKKTQVNLVGLPIREDLTPDKSVEDSRKLFKFESHKPCVFFMGGSQGAEKINTFIIENLEQLLTAFNVVHQVGPKNYERYKNEFTFMSEKLKEEQIKSYFFAPYFGPDLRDAFNAAEVVVSRAGASSIFEIASLGKPAILVPLADSANDHQRQNAYEYEKAGAGTVLLEENLLPTLLITEIQSILNNPERKTKMSEAAKKFFIPNAAEKIAKDVLEVAVGK